jgi:sulfur carrier protein
MNEESSTWQPPASITLELEPEGKTVTFPRPKTVAQLLNKLGVKQCTALVIRDGELLTPDRRIEIDDIITVRGVVSRG